METGVLIAAFLIAIVLGARLIQLLNAQHAARIAAHHYSDALPGVGRRRRKRPGPASRPTTEADHTGNSLTGATTPAERTTPS
ncbi:hypothetical protein [Streptomyces cahuitamycinicus]|uniref:Uncharacterized protein n=1 Tax=Streptomyces cahuitamycinicus TaxID=2070367 RepID=A0A2N8TF53_9ACTN|nr:hypothetical protein [Streptomyces cahuitamycinicus]PNG17615.1 hypothetical protein C1J00_35590 [Streptomyces cahuitamycinicus]